eukprot:11760-Amphidinium_carterae.3
MAMNSVASLSPDDQQLALTQVEQAMQQQAAQSHDLKTRVCRRCLALGACAMVGSIKSQSSSQRFLRTGSTSNSTRALLLP